MSEKLTAQQLAYYQKPAQGIKLTAKDMEKVEGDRLEPISNLAWDDVKNARKLKDASSFENDVEYKYYLLSAYSASLAAERGIK